MKQEYSTGVEMLLNRMDSNPDEFIDLAKWNKFIPKPRFGKQDQYGRWDNDMDADWGNYKAELEWFLEPHEIKAIHDRLKKVYKERYSQDLVKILFKPKRGSK